MSNTTTSDELDKKIKTMIGKLLLEAKDNTTVKKVLTQYDPSKDAHVNVTTLSKMVRKDLDDFATFLKLDLTNQSGDKLYSNRLKLAKRIVHEIMALYPSTCQECSSEYQVSFGETPPLRCYICLQGSHDCLELSAKLDHQTSVPAKLFGAVWLCSGCLDQNNPCPVDPPTKSAVPTPAQTPGTRTPVPGNPATDDSTTVPGSSNIAKDLQEKLLVLKNKQNKEEKEEQRKDVEILPNKSSSVCPKLLVGTCKHGLTGLKAYNGLDKCPLFHPKRCMRYMRYVEDKEHGCEEGDNCLKLHVTLCESALKSKQCFTESCTRAHPTGTKRYRDKKSPDNTRDKNQRGRASYKRDPGSRETRPSQRRDSVKAPPPPRQSHSNNQDLFLEFRSMLESLKKDVTSLKSQDQRGMKDTPKGPTPLDEVTALKRELLIERQKMQQMMAIWVPTQPTANPNSSALYSHVLQQQPPQNYQQNQFLPPNLTQRLPSLQASY